MASPAEQDRCTFAEYLTWEENERAEILDGVSVMMVHPSRIHQKISGEMFRQLANFLDGKKCEAYAAPFAVRPFETETDRPEDVQTVLEPDITVVCDKSKLDQHGCKGAPDMVIEVLSPSTHRHDRFVKLNLYQQAGVREYWIVSPEEKSVQVFSMVNGILRPHEFYSAEQTSKVGVLEGCFIELPKVFEE